MKKCVNWFLCCLALCIFLPALCEDVKPAVRVGAVTYDAKQVQIALDELLAINDSMGVTLSEAECAEATENMMENYVIRGLAENRIRELGLDQMDKNADYALKEQAQQAYEQIWQETRASFDAEAYSDKDITMLLEAAGASNEAYYQEYLLGYQMELLLKHYGVSVTLGDAEVDAFYQENYVAPYETRYANDIPLYESEVLFGEGESLFIPRGYRRIQQILLPIPEEIRSELDKLNARAEELYQTAEDAYGQIAALGAEGKDIEPAREAYAAAKAEMDALEVEKGKLRAKILPAVQDTVDEIYARLRAGETFETLATQYGDAADDLPYHPESEIWPDAYAQALNTLEAPGDVSQPVVYGEGVHILCYAEDIPGGAVMLNDEQRAAVKLSAQQSLSSQALIDLVSPWRADYEIETDISQLTY